MDERIEKAFSVANYMATLSNQRRIILEEYKQKLIFYKNGGTFNVDHTLIAFVKNTIDLGFTENVPFIDSNNFPILISDVQEFYESIVGVYFEANNEYYAKFTEIKSKRKVEDIVNL